MWIYILFTISTRVLKFNVTVEGLMIKKTKCSVEDQDSLIT